MWLIIIIGGNSIRKSAVFLQTDLESVMEISRDCTNMEQRKEVEGRTWAGVCRSWNSDNIQTLQTVTSKTFSETLLNTIKQHKDAEWCMYCIVTLVLGCMNKTDLTSSKQSWTTDLLNSYRALWQRCSISRQAAGYILILLLPVFPQQQVERCLGDAIIDHKLEGINKY